MEPKPGIRSSEFWLTVLAALLSVAVAGGVISKADADHLQSLVVAAVPALVAILTVFASAVHYTAGRVALKKGQADGPNPGDVLPLPKLYVADPPKGA